MKRQGRFCLEVYLADVRGLRLDNKFLPTVVLSFLEFEPIVFEHPAVPPTGTSDGIDKNCSSDKEGGRAAGDKSQIPLAPCFSFRRGKSCVFTADPYGLSQALHRASSLTVSVASRMSERQAIVHGSSAIDLSSFGPGVQFPRTLPRAVSSWGYSTCRLKPRDLRGRMVSTVDLTVSLSCLDAAESRPPPIIAPTPEDATQIIAAAPASRSASFVDDAGLVSGRPHEGSAPDVRGASGGISFLTETSRSEHLGEKKNKAAGPRHIKKTGRAGDIQGSAETQFGVESARSAGIGPTIGSGDCAPERVSEREPGRGSASGGPGVETWICRFDPRDGNLKEIIPPSAAVESGAISDTIVGPARENPFGLDYQPPREPLVARDQTDAGACGRGFRANEERECVPDATNSELSDAYFPAGCTGVSPDDAQPREEHEGKPLAGGRSPIVNRALLADSTSAATATAMQTVLAAELPSAVKAEVVEKAEKAATTVADSPTGGDRPRLPWDIELDSAGAGGGEDARRYMVNADGIPVQGTDVDGAQGTAEEATPVEIVRIKGLRDGALANKVFPGNNNIATSWKPSRSPGEGERGIGYISEATGLILGRKHPSGMDRFLAGPRMMGVPISSTMKGVGGNSTPTGGARLRSNKSKSGTNKRRSHASVRTLASRKNRAKQSSSVAPSRELKARNRAPQRRGGGNAAVSASKETKTDGRYNLQLEKRGAARRKPWGGGPGATVAPPQPSRSSSRRGDTSLKRISGGRAENVCTERISRHYSPPERPPTTQMPPPPPSPVKPQILSFGSAALEHFLPTWTSLVAEAAWLRASHGGNVNRENAGGGSGDDHGTDTDAHTGPAAPSAGKNTFYNLAAPVRSHHANHRRRREGWAPGAEEIEGESGGTVTSAAECFLGQGREREAGEETRRRVRSGGVTIKGQGVAPPVPSLDTDFERLLMEWLRSRIERNGRLTSTPLTKRSPGRSENNDNSDHNEHGGGPTSGNGFAKRSRERATDRTSNDGTPTGSSETSEKMILMFEETLEKLLQEKEAEEKAVWGDGRRDGDLPRPLLDWIEVVRKICAMSERASDGVAKDNTPHHQDPKDETGQHASGSRISDPRGSSRPQGQQDEAHTPAVDKPGAAVTKDDRQSRRKLTCLGSLSLTPIICGPYPRSPPPRLPPLTSRSPPSPRPRSAIQSFPTHQPEATAEVQQRAGFVPRSPAPLREEKVIAEASPAPPSPRASRWLVGGGTSGGCADVGGSIGRARGRESVGVDRDTSITDADVSTTAIETKALRVVDGDEGEVDEETGVWSIGVRGNAGTHNRHTMINEGEIPLAVEDYESDFEADEEEAEG